MISLGKTQRMKSFLDRRGHDFPDQVDMGIFNNRTVVYRSRLALRTAQLALKKKDLDDAMANCYKSMFLLSLEPITDPLVEVDNVAQVVATVVQVGYPHS